MSDSSRLYGPQDAWPPYGRPDPQKELKLCRAEGWWLREASSHIYGHLVCREPRTGARAGEDECYFAVFKTSGGASGSSTAEAIRRARASCPHRRDEGPQTRPKLALAQAALHRADRWLGVASSMIHNAQRRARLTEALELVFEHAHEAEKHLAELEDEELRLLAAEGAAADEAAAADAVGDTPSGLVTRADRELDRVHGLLRRGPQSEADARSALKSELRELRRRAEQLRSALRYDDPR